MGALVVSALARRGGTHVLRRIALSHIRNASTRVSDAAAMLERQAERLNRLRSVVVKQGNTEKVAYLEVTYSKKGVKVVVKKGIDAVTAHELKSLGQAVNVSAHNFTQAAASLERATTAARFIPAARRLARASKSLADSAQFAAEAVTSARNKFGILTKMSGMQTPESSRHLVDGFLAASKRISVIASEAEVVATRQAALAESLLRREIGIAIGSAGSGIIAMAPVPSEAKAAEQYVVETSAAVRVAQENLARLRAAGASSNELASASDQLAKARTNAGGAKDIYTELRVVNELETQQAAFVKANTPSDEEVREKAMRDLLAQNTLNSDPLDPTGLVSKVTDPIADAAIDKVIIPTTRLFVEGAVRLAGYTTESPEELEKDYKYVSDMARRFEDDDEVYSSATGTVPSVVIPSAPEPDPSSVSNDILVAVAAKKKLGQNSQSSWEVIEKETNQSIESSESENINQCLAEETSMSTDTSQFSTPGPRVS